MEIRGPKGWHPIAGVAEVEPGGSISTYDDDGNRQVLHFGWLLDGGPGVWRSKFGVDEEIGAFRATTALGGFEQLADLTEGPFEAVYRKPGRPLDVPLRFRLKRQG